MDTLRAADAKAQTGKHAQYGVRLHRRNAEPNLAKLRVQLRDKTYRTSEYTVFTIREPKERLIHRLPYYPDRIVHHAVMDVLKPMFVATFTADTYSCIEGRGIHAAVRKMKIALRDREATRYCLKLDITKFYPSVDHDVLKSLLRRKIKCKDTLWLLDEIIDSAEGLPIGNYLSQYLANFYLSCFDHWVKENKAVKHYFRYADDIVILGPDKVYLHGLLSEIKAYLNDNLKLQVKGNHQVFPVEARGIDFLGYVFYHTHTRMRKSIKQAFARKMAKTPNRQSAASYYGWAKHCNSNHLLNKIMGNFSDFGIKPQLSHLTGDKIKIESILNRPVKVTDFKIETSKFAGKGKCLHLQIEMDGIQRVVFVGSKVLMEMIQRVPKEGFPFTTTIVKNNGYLEFT